MSSTYRIFSKLFIIVFIIKVFDVFKNLVIASVLGVSADADIYTAMVMIPDSLIVLLGLDTIKGIVNSEYAHFYTKGETNEMWNSFKNLFNILFWISLAVVIVVIIFNNQIISLLLPGFSGTKKQLAAATSLIIFPILFFKVFIGYFNSVYNSIKSFYFPVVVPIIVGILILISVFLPYYKNEVIFNMSYANLVGNFLLFIIMIIGLSKLGGKFSFKKLEFDPITRKVIKASSTIIILVVCNQLFLFSKNFFASYFGEGAIAALHYSGTITSVIISMIFATFFTVLISNLSSLFSEEQANEAKVLFLKTTCTLIFVIVPIVIFFIVYDREILSLVYLRGNFDESGIEMTLKPFLWDALSLITFILYIFPTALFLAKKEYSLLTKIGSTVYLFGIFLNFLLSKYFGFYAISMATFFTTGIYGILLLIFSQKIIGNFKKQLSSIVLIFLCGGISFVILITLKIFIFDKLSSNSFKSFIIILSMNLLILSAVYYFLTSLFKVNFAKDILKSVRR